jgi:hypothetical protein
VLPDDSLLHATVTAEAIGRPRLAGASQALGHDDLDGKSTE